nr:hypothetical protein BaRGS_015208 [Batillaria attramentaria]
METIRDSKVPAVDTAITTLKASLATLESHIAGVDNKTDMVLTLAAEADNQIQNNMTAVLSDAYNEIGNCLPLWNLYRSFVVMLCNYGVDSLNGFWFSLGWGLFFFIPVVIVGITVAGYYSTMDSIRNWPEPEEEHDDEDFDDFQAKLDMLKEQDNEVNADYMD